MFNITIIVFPSSCFDDTNNHSQHFLFRLYCLPQTHDTVIFHLQALSAHPPSPPYVNLQIHKDVGN